MKTVIPSRHNWEAFCQEPQLTKQEQREWTELAREARSDDQFLAYICKAVQVEEAALQVASRQYTKDYSDLVAFADANRVLKRAEIATHARWQQEQQSARA